MASLSKKTTVFSFLAALCFFLFVAQLQSSDCTMKAGCFCIQAASHEVYSRKLLTSVMEADKMVTGKGMKYGGGAGWELREAPLGPDPLHHHGGSPSRKPVVTP
ncbi:OLC1v1004747C1 [Oldenlandia corymbosa var. corymbosa]|uniref:OLC1v1004747C1 n=1 Tax=Oldenlandia corymbosa var. corymbosa TaxID=529605 RepID=A0AAV1DD32_OLDCO|nr:OLC1v1004747C1 [Oldenlandia corymbosa var. corymbosa]